MNAIPKIATFTAEEFDLMAQHGQFVGKPRVELLDGVIYEMNPQHIPHAVIKMELVSLLRDALHANADLRVTSEVSLYLSENSVPEPDILIWRKGAKTGFVPLEAALIVIEVSDSTLRFDLGQKRKLYAAAGIPEYWVVDVNGKRIHQHAQPEGETYVQVHQIIFGDPVSAMSLAGLVIETQTLLSL